MNESASTTSGRDPSYWKLRRYFKPKAGGALKCSADAMKMWQTSEGRFWVRFVCAIDCAGFAAIYRFFHCSSIKAFVCIVPQKIGKMIDHLIPPKVGCH